jgi:hypothetical protein
MVPTDRPADQRASAPAQDLDEDLFDFLDVPPHIDVLGSLEAPRAEAPTSAAPQPAGDGRAAIAAEAPAPNTTEVDPDEDLFDFDAIFIAASEGAPPRRKPVEPEAPPAVAPAELAPPAPAGPAAPRAARSEPPARPRTQAQAKVAPAPRAARSRAPVFDPHTPPGLPPELADEPRRGRMIEVLAAAVLVLNTALILFAWRAGDDFRETLVQVTGAITQAVSEGQAQAGPPQPVVVEVPAPVEPVEPFEPFDETQPPAPTVPLERTVLEIAQERLAAGAFEEARRGLYRMLAGQDRAALPAEVVAEAELLIARSYYLQGKAVREDR